LSVLHRRQFVVLAARRRAIHFTFRRSISRRFFLSFFLSRSVITTIMVMSLIKRPVGTRLRNDSRQVVHTHHDPCARQQACLPPFRRLWTTYSALLALASQTRLRNGSRQVVHAHHDPCAPVSKHAIPIMVMSVYDECDSLADCAADTADTPTG